MATAAESIESKSKLLNHKINDSPFPIKNNISKNLINVSIAFE
jgi:hypothetical protein